MGEEGNQNQGGENQAQRALGDYFRLVVADNYSGIHRQASMPITLSLSQP